MPLSKAVAQSLIRVVGRAPDLPRLEAKVREGE
jgi:hypothetical protein